MLSVCRLCGCELIAVDVAVPCCKYMTWPMFSWNGVEIVEILLLVLMMSLCWIVEQINRSFRLKAGHFLSSRPVRICGLVKLLFVGSLSVMAAFVLDVTLVEQGLERAKGGRCRLSMVGGVIDDLTRGFPALGFRKFLFERSLGGQVGFVFEVIFVDKEFHMAQGVGLWKLVGLEEMFDVLIDTMWEVFVQGIESGGQSSVTSFHGTVVERDDIGQSTTVVFFGTGDIRD